MGKEVKKVYNVAEGAEEYKYIVVNVVDGDFWYWGAFNNLNRASEVARELKGEVLDVWERKDF